jgi:hypothetical protein
MLYLSRDERSQSRRSSYLLDLEQSSHAMGGNVLDRVPEAEGEYLCAENVLVHGESSIVYRISHTFACAGR